MVTHAKARAPAAVTADCMLYVRSVNLIFVHVEHCINLNMIVFSVLPSERTTHGQSAVRTSASIAPTNVEQSDSESAT